MSWNVGELANQLGSDKAQVFDTTDEIVEKITKNVNKNEHILIMSNGGFEGIHAKMLNSLELMHA